MDPAHASTSTGGAQSPNKAQKKRKRGGSGEKSKSKSNKPKAKPKKRKRKGSVPVSTGLCSRPKLPFVARENDHCETNREAYNDIAPVLRDLARLIGKRPKDLVIYDPYYCNGGVTGHLRSLGFRKVINECVDFYAHPRKPEEFDVLLTNPPYSDDHFERLLRFCKEVNKPSFLLLPHYCYTKPFFGPPQQQASFFICPGLGRRYHYTPPPWVDQEKGTTCIGKAKPTTSPFPTFWYCSIPDRRMRQTVIRQYEQLLSRSFVTSQLMISTGTQTQAKARAESNTTNSPSSRSKGQDSKKRKKLEKKPVQAVAPTSKFAKYAAKVVLCKNIGELPNELRSEFDRKRKRPNPKARRKLARLKAALH